MKRFGLCFGDLAANLIKLSCNVFETSAKSCIVEMLCNRKSIEIDLFLLLEN